MMIHISFQHHNTATSEVHTETSVVYLIFKCMIKDINVLQFEKQWWD